MTIEITAKNNDDVHKVKKSSSMYCNKLMRTSSLFEQECINTEKNHLQTIVIRHVVFLSNNASNELELFLLHLCCFGWGATYIQSPRQTHYQVCNISLRKTKNLMTQLSTFDSLSRWKERLFDSWWWVNMPLFYEKLPQLYFNISTINYLKYIKTLFRTALFGL